MQRFAFQVRGFALFASILALTPLAQAQDESPPSEGLDVFEVLLGTSLENGRVTSPETSFSRSGGRIFAMIRLRNPARQATTIRVAIERVDGPHRSGVSLDIPGTRRYRTVARFGSQRPPGRYRCVIRTEDGTELESVELTITE